MHFTTIFPMLIIYGLLITPIQNQFLKLVMPYRKRGFKLTEDEVIDYKQKVKTLFIRGTKYLIVGLLIHVVLVFVAIYIDSQYPALLDQNSSKEELLSSIPYILGISFVIAWGFMWLNFKLKGAIGLHTNMIHK